MCLSGHSASEHDPKQGAIVVKGGMAEQARTAWTKIAAILEAGGCTLADIVKAAEYVTPRGIEAYSEAARVRAEMLGAGRPALNTVVVQQLLRPQALIEIEVVARQGEGQRAAQGTAPKRLARENDGIVYLSSLLPINEDGSLIAPGDVAGQTRAIFRRAAEVLDSFELGVHDVVKTVDYLTPAALADYKKTAEARHEYFAPVFPAATGIIMPRVSHPDALIQIDIIASRRPRAIANPGWSSYANLTYSPGVRTGNLLFIAGHAALDPDTGRSVYPGDIVAQSEYIYSKILDVIAAAGGTPAHLVKTIEYVTPAGLPRYREAAKVRTRILRAPLPAATGVICERLLRPDFQLEVDSFAIIE
ncbi:MAG: RidA family protein [Deltaproteobacteria bacterium]|nr:RidA family protein [Deltaproteobacteria bacterium]